MNPFEPNHDFLRVYDETIIALENEPDSQVLQHRAVLALARAGALDFACAEYERYGLDKVRYHEDIMALGGRLLKDLALASTGKDRIDYARQSADKYEAAFKDSNGYYSGINAASMALVAGIPEDIVNDRARTILKTLPDTANLDKEELYFVEATRAEAHLILGEAPKAATFLRNAIFHDPLNYTAHASTLKQFRMILRARGEQIIWTQPFTPPKAAHFAGHLFTPKTEAAPSQNTLGKKKIQALKTDISEAIQSNDIGFGYGALAAGSDILIAETLLSEGAELHVILPVDPKSFQEFSVTPFGKSWSKRFHKCLAKATSVRILTETQTWPNSDLGSYASQIAMGLAVLRASTLSTGMAQMLVWDGEASLDPMSTAFDAKIWNETDREQIVIRYPGKRGPRQSLDITPASETPTDLMISLRVTPDFTLKSERRKVLAESLKSCADTHKAIAFVDDGKSFAISFNDPFEAAQCAAGIMIDDVPQEMQRKIRIGGYSGFARPENMGDQLDAAAHIARSAPPGSVFIGENFAAILNARFSQLFATEYVGTSTACHRLDAIRMFHLQRRPQD